MEQEKCTFAIWRWKKLGHILYVKPVTAMTTFGYINLKLQSRASDEGVHPQKNDEPCPVQINSANLPEF